MGYISLTGLRSGPCRASKIRGNMGKPSIRPWTLIWVCFGFVIYPDPGLVYIPGNSQTMSTSCFWLVLWNMNFMTFHSVGELSSSQLTFTPWFFRGVGQPPTRLVCQVNSMDPWIQCRRVYCGWLFMILNHDGYLLLQKLLMLKTHG